MVAVVGKRVRTIQPQPWQAQLIDWSNPITKDIVLAISHADQGYGFAAEGLSQYPYIGATQANTPQGTGGRSTSTSNYLYQVGGHRLLMNTYSLFAFGSCASGTTQNALDLDNGTTRYFQFRIANGQVQMIPFDTGGNAVVVSPSPALSVTEMSRGFAMGATVSPSRATAWQNDAFASGVPTSGTFVAPTQSQAMYVGSRASGTQGWATGALSLAVAWSRTLTDAEMRSMIANPWQLFRPAMRRLWMPMPTVSTTSELTPGVSALSIVGHAPTIEQTANIALSPAPAVIGVTGYAPTIEQSANTILTPAPAALVITGYSPTLEQTASLALTPGTAELAIMGYAPSVEQAPIPPDPRYARPLFDVSAGNWTPSSGDYLAAMLSESTPDSATSIHTDTPGACEIRLAPVVDPQSSSGQVVRYQASSSTSGGLTVRLKQGSIVIASWTHDALTSVPTVYTQVLTASQCDAITDYGDLRFEFEAL